MSEKSGTPLLEVRALSKHFPGVQALDRVNLSLEAGEILAVIGENGAGKSTLMKILAGVQEADSGTVLLDGVPVAIDSVRASTALGIALIHQELNLADNLDIGANIFLGREPRNRGMIDNRKIARESALLLEELGLTHAPRTLVSSLTIGQQQLVEIAKALSVHARILIMDEPTSSLTQHETEHLYEVIRRLRAQGVSIIYISHRLGEVKAIADRVVVLRDGANAGELAREAIEHDAMVRLMVGREVAQARNRKLLSPGEIVLRVEGLRTQAYPRHAFDLELRMGEIVGMAGLVGAGRTEILETIFGVMPAVRGNVEVAGTRLVRLSPAETIAAGVALVPEDRKQQGLVLEMTVRDNLTLAAARQNQRWGFRVRKQERTLSKEMLESLGIRTTSDLQVVQFLSGGNQQKVVLGKWLGIRPRVLLMDEPTRGIDVGAKREVYLLMEKLAEEGVAILFVSSEMEEIITMSDRVLVIHEGRISGELRHEELTEERVMQYATGYEQVAS